MKLSKQRVHKVDRTTRRIFWAWFALSMAGLYLHPLWEPSRLEWSILVAGNLLSATWFVVRSFLFARSISSTRRNVLPFILCIFALSELNQQHQMQAGAFIIDSIRFAMATGVVLASDGENPYPLQLSPETRLAMFSPTMQRAPVVAVALSKVSLSLGGPGLGCDPDVERSL